MLNRLRKINEELNKVLNEISYETAEKVYNARNQQAYDAIKKMDRAEKFMKNRQVTTQSFSPGFVADLKLTPEDIKKLEKAGFITNFGTGDMIVIPPKTQVSISEANGKYIVIVVGVKIITDELLDGEANNLDIEDIIGNKKEDVLKQIIDGVFDIKAAHKEGKLLIDFVMPRIDELSEDDLTEILERYGSTDNSLFPSHWKYSRDENLPIYPAKLARALANSNVSENISDIYNVFYANMDASLFEDAIPVWQEALLHKNRHDWEHLGMLLDYPDQLEEVLDTLRERYPEFVDKLVAIYDLPDKTEYEV